MNPWALLQYAHNMSGAVITGCVRDVVPWGRSISWKTASPNMAGFLSASA